MPADRSDLSAYPGITVKTYQPARDSERSEPETKHPELAPTPFLTRVRPPRGCPQRC